MKSLESEEQEVDGLVLAVVGMKKDVLQLDGEETRFADGACFGEGT